MEKLGVFPAFKRPLFPFYRRATRPPRSGDGGFDVRRVPTKGFALATRRQKTAVNRFHVDRRLFLFGELPFKKRRQLLSRRDLRRR